MLPTSMIPIPHILVILPRLVRFKQDYCCVLCVRGMCPPTTAAQLVSSLASISFTQADQGVEGFIPQTLLS